MAIKFVESLGKQPGVGCSRRASPHPGSTFLGCRWQGVSSDGQGPVGQVSPGTAEIPRTAACCLVIDIESCTQHRYVYHPYYLTNKHNTHVHHVRESRIRQMMRTSVEAVRNECRSQACLGLQLPSSKAASVKYAAEVAWRNFRSGSIRTTLRTHLDTPDDCEYNGTIAANASRC